MLTYDFIIRELWGPKAKTDNQILRVNMANIRRKIEPTPGNPQYIFTEVGVGYRMREGDCPLCTPDIPKMYRIPKRPSAEGRFCGTRVSLYEKIKRRELTLHGFFICDRYRKKSPSESAR